MYHYYRSIFRRVILSVLSLFLFVMEYPAVPVLSEANDPLTVIDEGEYHTTYENRDGSYTTEFYSDRIRYYDPDDELVEIDESLIYYPNLIGGISLLSNNAYRSRKYFSSQPGEQLSLQL